MCIPQAQRYVAILILHSKVIAEICFPNIVELTCGGRNEISSGSSPVRL